MNKSRRVIALMLAVIMSMASISVVYATTEDASGQSAIEKASLEATTIDEAVNDATGNVMLEDEIIGEEEDPESEEVTITPEVSVVPEQTPEPTDVPVEIPEVTPEITEVPGLAKDVKAVEGWNGSGTQWQYFKKDDSGVLVQLSGWRDIDGKTYYFDPANSNYAVGGFKVIKDANDGNKNKIYYFAETGGKGVFGMMATGWQAIKGNTYYFVPDGVVGTKGSMLTGWQLLSGKKYYFSKASGLGKKGRMFIGWQKLDSQKYYFNPNGGYGEKGQALLGWQNIDGQKYYFSKAANFTKRGRALQGWQKLDNQVYYFSKAANFTNKGRALQGWVKISGKKFYFSKTTNFDSKGRMLAGWQKIDGKTYYLSKAKGLGKRGAMLTDWVKISGQWFYMNASGVRQESKWMRIKGPWYYFNASGVALTGWHNINGLNYYFSSSCALDQDVRDMVGGPYSATINRRTNTVTIYGNGGTTPVKAFACSVGMPNTPTPTGTFYTPAKYRWKELMGPSWGQYATRIVGGILFHSVAGSNTTSYNLSAAEYNRLGGPASHGCVRLCVRDAKWIYDNCALGMKVTIGDNVYQPFDQPASIKIPAGQTWDPTDPNV